MKTKALIYKAGASVSNCIWASSKITLTNAQERHRRSNKMVPVGMRKQALKDKALPTFQEMASQRIVVLDAAISALDSRADANPKKLKKRDKHLAEKADLERQISQPAQEHHGNSSSEAAHDSLAMYVNSFLANHSSSYC